MYAGVSCLTGSLGAVCGFFLTFFFCYSGRLIGIPWDLYTLPSSILPWKLFPNGIPLNSLFLSLNNCTFAMLTSSVVLTVIPFEFLPSVPRQKKSSTLILVLPQLRGIEPRYRFELIWRFFLLDPHRQNDQICS